MFARSQILYEDEARMRHQEPRRKMRLRCRLRRSKASCGSTSRKIPNISGINCWYSGMGTRYYDVKPPDTLQSICSRHNISESALWRANFGFAGPNGQFGPKKLIIPNTISISNKNESKHRQDRSKRSVSTVHVDYPAIGDMFVAKECFVQRNEAQQSDTMIKPCLPTIF